MECMKAQFDLILNYSSCLSTPYLLMGDLNAFLFASGNWGGDSHTNVKTNLFNSCVHELGVIDLGFSGPMITWNNHKDGIDNI